MIIKLVKKEDCRRRGPRRGGRRRIRNIISNDKIINIPSGITTGINIPIEPIPIELIPIELIPIELIPIEPIPIELIPIEPIPIELIPIELIPIELIPIEDCISDVQNGHEIDNTIQIDNISIPKGDKRSDCKYYDIESRSCSVYKNRSCYGCKKKNFEKMTPRQKGYLKRFEKRIKICPKEQCQENID
jgi:hypothetical protein